VVNLGRRGVVNFNRRDLVSLNRRRVVNFIGACNQKAFARYEQLFKPFITKKQSTAKTFARSFVPKSEIGIWMRNTFINLMFLPYFSRLFVRRFMYDSLKLKDY